MSETKIDVQNGTSQIAPNATTQNQIFYGNQFAEKILGVKERP